MRASSDIVSEMLSLMSELWESLEQEGTSLKDRVLEVRATDQFMVSVSHYAAEDRHLVLRKRARNVG